MGRLKMTGARGPSRSAWVSDADAGYWEDRVSSMLNIGKGAATVSAASLATTNLKHEIGMGWDH